jgi:hypothetical protein
MSCTYSRSYAFQEAERIAPKSISRLKLKEFFEALTNRPIGGILMQVAILFKFPRLAIVLVTAVDATGLLVPAAAAANYTFTKIADNSPGSNLLIPGSSSSIALNASGKVASSAHRADSKGNPTSNLVLTGSGGALTIIEDSGTLGEIAPVTHVHAEPETTVNCMNSPGVSIIGFARIDSVL